MAEALRHRIRAAGLLVVEQRILLVRHEVGGDIYWIPPGGGFESECDESTKDTVRREFSRRPACGWTSARWSTCANSPNPPPGASTWSCSTASTPGVASRPWPT